MGTNLHPNELTKICRDFFAFEEQVTESLRAKYNVTAETVSHLPYARELNTALEEYLRAVMKSILGSGRSIPEELKTLENVRHHIHMNNLGNFVRPMQTSK